ncbi:hypothetical protein ES702_05804 [subsurface metagenome]
MGYWLKDKVKSWSSQALDDIQRWDLPGSGVVSALQIVATVRRHATDRDATTKAKLLEDGIDALEVIEGGSKIIKSLDGPLLMAANLFDFKQIPYYQQSGMTGDHNLYNFFINFGRYPMDKVYGLDLAKHEECQLIIDHNFDATAKIGFAADTVEFDIWIWRYIGEALPLLGYFKTSEKETYTQANSAGAEHRLELPRKNPIRRILIRSYLTQKTPGECMTSVELDINDGEYKPIYAAPTPSCNAYYAQKGIRAAARGNDGVYSGQTEVYIETNVPVAQDITAISRYGYGAQANQIQFTQEAGDIGFRGLTASFELMWSVTGTGYQYVTPLCFDIPDELESYFPTDGLSKVELIITEKAVASVNKIVLDELVKY